MRFLSCARTHSTLFLQIITGSLLPLPSPLLSLPSLKSAICWISLALIHTGQSLRVSVTPIRTNTSHFLAGQRGWVSLADFSVNKMNLKIHQKKLLLKAYSLCIAQETVNRKCGGAVFFLFLSKTLTWEVSNIYCSYWFSVVDVNPSSEKINLDLVSS